MCVHADTQKRNPLGKQKLVKVAGLSIAMQYSSSMYAILFKYFHKNLLF
jgi:hypothetical protein